MDESSDYVWPEYVMVNADTDQVSIDLNNAKLKKVIDLNNPQLNKFTESKGNKKYYLLPFPFLNEAINKLIEQDKNNNIERMYFCPFSNYIIRTPLLVLLLSANYDKTLGNSAYTFLQQRISDEDRAFYNRLLKEEETKMKSYSKDKQWNKYITFYKVLEIYYNFLSVIKDVDGYTEQIQEYNKLYQKICNNFTEALYQDPTFRAIKNKYSEDINYTGLQPNDYNYQELGEQYRKHEFNYMFQYIRLLEFYIMTWIGMDTKIIKNFISDNHELKFDEVPGSYRKFAFEEQMKAYEYLNKAYGLSPGGKLPFSIEILKKSNENYQGYMPYFGIIEKYESTLVPDIKK